MDQTRSSWCCRIRSLKKIGIDLNRPRLSRSPEGRSGETTIGGGGDAAVVCTTYYFGKRLTVVWGARSLVFLHHLESTFHYFSCSPDRWPLALFMTPAACCYPFE